MKKVIFCIGLLTLGNIYAMDSETRGGAFLAKEIDATCCFGLYMAKVTLPFFKDEWEYDASEHKSSVGCCCHGCIVRRFLRAFYEAETERNVAYKQSACCWNGLSKKAPLTDDGCCLCYACCGLLQLRKKKKVEIEDGSVNSFENDDKTYGAYCS